MPARNSIKQYIDHAYYHIYNRGVEKRLIFQDAQDNSVFLSYLKEYLTPKDEQELRQRLSDLNTPYKEKDKILKALRMNNFCGEITLLAYCLMPNHFHFFIKQKNALSIDKFMQSLCTRYTMYFNRKYKRVGSLFQAVYKAVLITNDEQFLHLSRYLHKQALASQVFDPEAQTRRGETLQNQTLQNQTCCSYPEYIGRRKTTWVHPEEILLYFSKTTPALLYKNFVFQSEDTTVIQKLTLED